MPWKERYALTGFGASTTTMRWNSSFGATATGCFKKSAPLFLKHPVVLRRLKSLGSVV